jgi:hypothetical protein
MPFSWRIAPMPKPEIVERALAAIKGYAQYEYFFENLDSPAWLEPLAAKGMFKHPQPVEKVDPYIRFPFWPESRYLVRMSKLPESQAGGSQNYARHTDLR